MGLTKIISSLLILLVLLLPFGVSAIEKRNVFLSIVEIDPQAVGSKARPERLRQIQAGIRMAIRDRQAELNKAGLELGSRYHNIGESHHTAMTATQNAVDSDSVAAVGLPTSYYADFGGKALTGSELVMISPYATSTDLRKYAENLILMSPMNSEFSKGVEETLAKHQRDSKPVIVVPWDNAYSKNLYEELSTEFRQKSHLIKVLDDERNHDLIVKQVLETKPSAVILFTFPAFTGKLIKAFSHKNFKGPFYGGDSWGEGENAPLHKITRGLDFVGWTLRANSEYIQDKRVDQFVERFSKDADVFFGTEAGLYYDAVNLIVDRILEIGTAVNREKLRKALLESPRRCGIFSGSCVKGKESSKMLHLIKIDGTGFKESSQVYVH